jgi:UDP-N-acetylmuramoyl-tripeptide--D-alanyl-D-alanine ligase
MIGTSVKEIAKCLGTSSLMEKKVLGFAMDSGKVEPGFVFFALKGARVDGHDYVSEAFSKGAILAIVSEKKEEWQGEVIVVKDVLLALQELARKRVKDHPMRTVGVTGSVGKTTTKEFIATLLEGHFFVGKTPGSANSQRGLPLSILNLQKMPDIFIAEMGMSEHGGITSLLSIVPPEIVVVTKVALAHSVNFPGGIEEIAFAKSEILGSSGIKKAFLNNQVRGFKAFQKVDGVFYGKDEGEAQISLKKGLFQIEIGKEKSPLFSLPFEASHLVENFLAAALVVKEMGLSFEKIIEGAQKLVPYKNRFERVEKDGVVFINDSYNAGPVSMKAALSNLPSPKSKGKTIAVLGEMGELGVFSEKAHAEIGSFASSYVDVLLCAGDECLHMMKAFAKSGKKVLHFPTVELLKREVDSHIQVDDVVLLKASNLARMWTILEKKT